MISWGLDSAHGAQGAWSSPSDVVLVDQATVAIAGYSGAQATATATIALSAPRR